MRADTLLGELGFATQERDALELQLYALRSEHQRTISRNEEMATALENRRQLESELHALQHEHLQVIARHEVAVTELSRSLDIANTRIHELEQASATRLHARDLELVYAKLTGRLTILSSDIAHALRARGTTGDPCAVTLYLSLLEKALTGDLSRDTTISPWSSGYDPETRLIGRDWPATAQTMIGLARLRNIRALAEQILEQQIPGDFLEAGVWRGGACIYMRGILAAYGVGDRSVWVADSFEGLPEPEPEKYPADTDDPHHTFTALQVSAEQVRSNFEQYGLLDHQVRFLKGWFADTLSGAPIGQLALLRLDGDMYSSTMQTLEALYNKVSPGGFVIIDDYILGGCRQATDDFRSQRSISQALQEIDGAAVFWRKPLAT
ncbi:MAG TPA: TylF/MycF family methyltransferase [Acetobacteraceae bacterium]|nr:TylF/MycF family methyltransferase [Acetobacteraceae bacterium]